MHLGIVYGVIISEKPPLSSKDTDRKPFDTMLGFVALAAPGEYKQSLVFYFFS